MPEDKLTHDERVRLEALAQAIASAGWAPAERVIEYASRYEAFIRGESSAED